ncbi:MAG: hypothetical protein ABIS17_02405 [Casimicrobiaceae bacterium]
MLLFPKSSGRETFDASPPPARVIQAADGAAHIASRLPPLLSTLLPALLRAILPALIAAISLAATSGTVAETLGDARQVSRLGEPLRVSIPVRADGGAPLQERCLAVIAPGQSDGLPHILTANVVLDRQGPAPGILVTTGNPVRDAVIRIVLRTHCDGASRAYTLFLEPPGSTRQIRAVVQPGPRVPAMPNSAAVAAESERSAAAPPVTTIAVNPSAGSPLAAASQARTPASMGRDPVEPANRAPSVSSRVGGANAPALAPPPATKPAPVPAPTSANRTPAGAPPVALAPQPAARASTAEASAPRATPPARVAPMATPAQTPAAPTTLVAAAPTGPPAAARAAETAGANAASEVPGVESAKLEAENETLKQRLAQLSGELQRLQQPSRTPSPRASAPEAAENATSGTFSVPGWEVAWPVIVALAGLAAVVLGGLMWRRHHAGEEWPLTGPPSHRLASRTSLAEEPVPFKQAGLGAEAAGGEPSLERSPPSPQPGLRLVGGAAAPAAILMQPSADDLGRDLEQELFIAEQAHSALERSHPDIIEALTRSWGTAVARHQLATLLQSGSEEVARMSGEAVAELRLLLRVAEEHSARAAPEPAPPAGYAPPAPAW